MKIRIFLAFIAISFLVSTNCNAQYNPNNDGSDLLSIGVGVSDWGIPIFARYEVPVASNVTVGGQISFQTKGETYSSYKYKHTITGLNARGSYHFNELLEVPREWDFYAGASLGYYIWNTKYNGPGPYYDYSGSGSGGLNIGAHIGARYFFKNNAAFNVELVGGSILAGGTVGVTFLL